VRTRRGSGVGAPALGRAAAAEGGRRHTSYSYDLIVVGCSLGGMQAMQVILSGLPDDFCIPIAVVQHRHKQSNEGLPAFLRRASKMPVVDVEDKQWIKPGTVYLAPANYHLLVEHGEFNLSVDEAVRHSRPSVDVLFESAADAYGSRVIGVVLTGSNVDGTRGAERIKRRGGVVIAQDPATADAPEMPEGVIAAGVVDQILPLQDIAPYLVELCVVRERA
jgi:two-component system chemotaxis response regulator CheB